MATPRMDITSFVGKLLEEDDVDLLREGVRVLARALMETEVSSQIGGAPYERSSSRTAYRNGYRTRTWDTRVGTIELKMSKVTAGTYFPSLLEPRRRREKALHAVVCEAYVKGISTRKVDELVRALGMDGISRSEVSRICKAIDEEVKTFLARGIEGSYPYLWLDATFHKIREGGRVVSVATVVAVGVSEAGHRSVLGVDTGPSEDHSFWVAFLRSLVRRGLKGVRLVTSDAHEGLRQAVAKVFSGTQWQRCRVHFMRNLLSVVPKAAQETVAAMTARVAPEGLAVLAVWPVPPNPIDRSGARACGGWPSVTVASAATRTGSPNGLARHADPTLRLIHLPPRLPRGALQQPGSLKLPIRVCHPRAEETW